MRRSSIIKHDLFLPWTVVQNWHGKIAIVDSRNDDNTTTKGRVCNLPQGEEGRGLHIAKVICDAVNRVWEEPK